MSYMPHPYGSAPPTAPPPDFNYNQYAPVKEHNVEHKVDTSATTDERTVTVSGRSEYIIEPDQVEIIVLIRAAKPTIDEVKLSVQKRRDYVITVAQQNKVHYRVTEDFVPQVDKNHRLECQVTLSLANYKKAQLQRNQLIEKLCDNSTVVSIQPLLFSHSQHLIAEWREKLPIDAINRAKFKAKEICESLRVKRGEIKTLVVGDVEEKLMADVDNDLTETASEITRRRKTKIMSCTAKITFFIK